MINLLNIEELHMPGLDGNPKFIKVNGEWFERCKKLPDSIVTLERKKVWKNETNNQ